MTFATSPSLHVRKAPQRTLPPARRNTSRKAFAGGLTVAIVSAVTIMVVLAGAGWMFSALLKAHSNTRSTVTLGPASSRVMGLVLTSEGVAMPPVAVAGLSLPEPKVSAQTYALNPIRVRAVFIPGYAALADPSGDPDYTGSLGATESALAPADVAPVDIASVSRSIVSSVSDDAAQLPLPRARPRLAALPPAGSIGIEPDEDSASAKTAIYDITAQTVYMPDGQRLEAHSGLGGMMDDPRNVHVRMRGATPPNTYKLRLRESLFHGVEAIRMTPVDDKSMFGRDGILAHSYMLGPNGQSNGCVSFKDYPKFLRAFKRGEVDRIVVVAKLPGPAYATRPTKIRSAAAFATPSRSKD